MSIFFCGVALHEEKVLQRVIVTICNVEMILRAMS
jgi:hypothetical protein